MLLQNIRDIRKRIGLSDFILSLQWDERVSGRLNWEGMFMKGMQHHRFLDNAQTGLRRGKRKDEKQIKH